MSDLSPEDKALFDGARRARPADGAKERVRGRLAAKLGAGAGLGAAGIATKASAASAIFATTTGKIALAAIVVATASAGVGVAVSTREAPPTAPSISAIARAVPTATARAVSTKTSEPANTIDSRRTIDWPQPLETAALPAASAFAIAEPTATNGAPSPTATEPVRTATPPSTAIRSTTNQVVAPAPIAPSAKPEPAASSAPASSLADETALLRNAHDAMTNGHADQALSLLDAHARSYPNGMLSEERDAQRVLVLCALGRKDDAAKAAGTFVASHPSSPLVGRVQGSCAGQGSK